jgi:hypothetical protein
MVNGEMFKVAMVESCLDVAATKKISGQGVIENFVNDISLVAGSIIATLDIAGAEYVQILNEAVDEGLLVVKVDGQTYIARHTYQEVNPFLYTVLCHGVILGELSYHASDFPKQGSMPGFDNRLETLTDNELYNFGLDVNNDLQNALLKYVSPEDGFIAEMCSVVTVGTFSDSIQVQVILSNSSLQLNRTSLIDVDFETTDLNATGESGFVNILEVSTRAVASAFDNQELSVLSRSGSVDPAEINMISVGNYADAMFFEKSKAKSSTASLVGTVAGIIVMCALLMVLLYRVKRMTESEHQARVHMMMIQPDIGVFDIPATPEPTDADIAKLFDGMDMHGIGNALVGDRRASISNNFDDSNGNDYFGKKARPSEINFYEAAAKSQAAAAPGSASYFSVGEINAPKYLPGPGGNSHFYPTAGMPALVESLQRGGGSNPAYLNANDDFDMGFAAGPGFSNQIVGGGQGRPSLFNDADEEFKVTNNVLENQGWSSNAGLESPPGGGEDWDTDWGSGGFSDAHNFPTLKAATLTGGTGLGYAMPTDIPVVESVPVEATVHFAAVRVFLV